jgi:hypothetical protein
VQGWNRPLTLGTLALSAVAALIAPWWLVLAAAVGVLVAARRKVPVPGGLIRISRLVLAVTLLPLWLLVGGLLVRLGLRRSNGDTGGR